MHIESEPLLKLVRRALELVKKENIKSNSGYIDLLKSIPDDKEMQELLVMNANEYRQCNMLIDAITNELSK